MFLARFEVKVTGEWTSERPWNWHGLAGAAEPITALTLLNVGEHTAWARARRMTANSLPIRLYIDRYDQAWIDVQTAWGVGRSGRRARTALAGPPEEFPLSLSAEAGEPAWLVSVVGTPRVRLGALFVAERDTRSVRGPGSWRLRQGVTARSDDLTAALNYGRTGFLPRAVGPSEPAAPHQ